MPSVINSNKLMDDKSIAEHRATAISSWGGVFLETYSKIEPSITLMSELELTDHFQPTPVEYRLRKRFWQMTNDNSFGNVTELVRGICSDTHFYNRLIKNPYKFSWILIPLETHQEMFDEFFHVLLKKMRKEAINLPLNEKTFASFVKILDSLANRSAGPVVQRIDQRSTNVNVDGNQVIRDVIDKDQMDQKLIELKNDLLALPAEAKTVNEPE